MTRTTTILLAGLALFVLGAVPAAADSVAMLGAVADECTAKHGFDPRKPGAVAETELAEGERAWRACMYAGIESRIIPSSTAADEWRVLIAADKAMTDAIAAGTETRSQRAARLQMLVANVRLAELAETEKRINDTKKRLELQDQIEEIRRSAPRFF